MHVQIALYDGFDIMDSVVPYVVLATAGELSGGKLTVEMATIEGPRDVPSMPTGMPIPATATLDVSKADAILVPGAAGRVKGPGAEIPIILRRAAGELHDVLAEAMADSNTLVYTVCGGSALLAKAGLIEGRNATTHHLQYEDLEEGGANPIRARVVDDGDFVSGGGVTSGLEVGFYFVERELDSQLALAVGELMEYEPRGTVWRPTAVPSLVAAG